MIRRLGPIAIARYRVSRAAWVRLGPIELWADPRYRQATLWLGPLRIRLG